MLFRLGQALMLNAAMHRNQWTQMFPSRGTDIGSFLPLWAVQDDGTPGISNVNTFMGGWTVAYAKQYSLSEFISSLDVKRTNEQQLTDVYRHDYLQRIPGSRLFPELVTPRGFVMGYNGWR